MEYLVDGYNLLHAWDRATPKTDSLRAARIRLLEALAAFAERTGARVTAVFDGTDLPYPDRASHKGVRILFSRTPEDADRLIAERLERTHHARDTRVVSSDNAVRRQARAAGAQAVSASEFARWLREAPAAKAQSRSRQAPLTEGEIRAWAKDFGVDA